MSRRRWRVWRGVQDPYRCPLCETNVDAMDLIEHLWVHRFTSELPPKNVDASTRCPVCFERFNASRSKNGVARHLRVLYDAGKLDEHLIAAATKRAFEPKLGIDESWPTEAYTGKVIGVVQGVVQGGSVVEVMLEIPGKRLTAKLDPTSTTLNVGDLVSVNGSGNLVKVWRGK